MHLPPDRILKGLDEKLAEALETTHSIVFVDWREVDPEDAGEVANELLELPGSGRPWEEPGWENLDAEARFRVILYHLGGDGPYLEQLFQHAAMLIEAKDARDLRTLYIHKTVVSPKKPGD